MISKQTIEQILDRCDIKDVAEDCVSRLRRAGTTYKACCPFHSERTPSFTIFPNTGTYKCFGCGEQGDSIGLLMKAKNLSFTEAVKTLGRQCSVEVDDTPLSDKEQQEYRTKEAMWAANERLMRVYEKQLASNKAARDYAHGRWGEEYCKLHSIGYCPKGARLVDEAKVSEEICEQLGLKKKGGYDFLNGRVIIPIRDRQQHVIGFTARIFPDDDNSPKYMNSRESLIYAKSKSIFGIDTAWREAARQDKLMLVEGAPDCMRLQSIGILNTVAPLGTAWNKEQFDILRRATSQLCFLPDADPPKQGEPYGPGIKAVIKAGEEAVKMGFTVTVRQIPVGSIKQDPDSFCTSLRAFNSLEEQDFILWLAELLLTDSMTKEQQGKVINRLALLMTFISDPTTTDMYVATLAKKVGTRNLWKKAIETQRTQLAEEEAKEKADKETDLYRQFGFNVEKGKDGRELRYYSVNEQGVYVWSNFTMRPMFHIKDIINAKRLYVITNEFGKSDLIELKQEDLVSLQKFMVRVESMGNYIWKATQKELNKLKQYLYEKTETALEVKQLGWQRQGFFAFGNGIFDGEKFIKVDEYGIVRLTEENYYLPANSRIYRNEESLFQFERKFVHLGLSTATLRDYTEQIFRVFGDNGRIGFMFLLATLFRDIVRKVNGSFPILNLFGQKGSGKTELGHALMAFFIIENTPPNLNNSTLPALNNAVAAVANALVHIDEYKNGLENSKYEFLKGLWDGTGRSRMNMDLDKKMETTPVNCGVILSGQEMPTADIALFSRLIFLTFSKSEFTSKEKREYNALVQMRATGMTHLTLELLKLRKKVEGSYQGIYDSTRADIYERLDGKQIEDRTIKNWLAPLAMLRCLENSIDTSLSYKDMFGRCIEGITYQNAQCKQNNELAEFWNMVQYLTAEGELIEGGDFRIEYEKYIRTDEVNCEWPTAKAVLYLQKSRLFMLYKKHGKSMGDTLLPEGTLKHYLRNSREYLGEKKSVRFKVYIKGIVQFNLDCNNMKRETTTVQRSYCFDYAMLAQNYSINLEKSTGINIPDEKSEDQSKKNDTNKAEQETLPF